ncbi:MAG TPA: 16S rRNA (adenine(1518)-N(6)/adenine(1519)-N(6))-dimethyltransferase RsmA [Azospirillaceae bacterium]|nr:16S rRNA (adenine(1518)-N(6)/adenine(1519)-N(6))-dimethyltransferase RsmA [Azospirillaceae bacterium]
MSRVDDLPPLREVIARFDLGARKSLGQHFLFDLNLTARVARAAGDLTGVTVVEVGPGPGGLTRALLGTNAREVVAVERDPRFVEALAEVIEAAEGRLRLVQADALKVDLEELVPAPRAVIANLPYNVGTPLLFGWLRRMEAFRSLTLMFQKEVVDRIVAEPRSKAYGRLAVMCQWRAECRSAFDIPARAFTPPPKVVSAVVHMTPRSMPADAPDFETMETVVGAAFNQRRKMLRASLKALGMDTESLILEAGLEPTARAEEIDVAGFVALAKAWAAQRGA